VFPTFHLIFLSQKSVVLQYMLHSVYRRIILLYLRPLNLLLFYQNDMCRVKPVGLIRGYFFIVFHNRGS